MTQQLGIADFVLGPEGLCDYYWPVGRQEVAGMREAFLPPLIGLIRDGLAKGVAGAEALLVALAPLASEGLALYQGGALAERARLGGRELACPAHYRLWPALLAGTRPADHGVVAQLTEAFPAPNAFEFLRSLALFPFDILPRSRGAETALRLPSRMPHPALLRRAVVSTKRGEILERHAAQESRPVVYCRHKDWFRPVDGGELRARLGRAMAPALLDAVLAAFVAGCAEGGFAPSENILGYYRDLCRTTAALVQAHMERLRARPERLPRRLWHGSGGNLWDRMLGRAVREQGGSVTAHSHAGGSEYELFPYDFTNEYAVCDEYVAYTEGQARLMAEKLDPAYLFGSAPRFGSVGGSVAPPAQAGPAAAGRTLMYVDGGYEGERVQLNPGFPDVVLADWQARLFARLRDAGWRVLYKPHPEFSPPAGLLGPGVGVEALSGRFEELLGQADLFLFDYPQTSTFNVALRSGRPMALVDFGGTRWYGNALELLRKRCVVVPGGFDAANRAQVDWEGLLACLEQARTMPPDTGFVEYFLT